MGHMRPQVPFFYLMKVTIRGVVMQTILQKLSFSIILKILGALMVIVSTIQALHEPSWNAALQDPKLYADVVTALMAFFAKQNSEHGTPAVPLDPKATAALKCTKLKWTS